MDVERIQKINSLALDLMKQGLAQDRDDAIAQAEQVYKRKDADTYQEMRDIIRPETKQKEPTQELTQDTIKEILSKNTQFLVKTIQEFQAKITTMEREVQELRTKLNYQGLPTVREFVSNVPTPIQNSTVAQPEPVSQQVRQTPIQEVTSSQVQETPQQETQQATSQEGKNPRSGNFNSEDVSIENVFYMGSK